MAERTQHITSAIRSAGVWLLLRVLFLVITAATLAAFIGGFIAVLSGVDWLAVTVFAEQGGRDYWLITVLMIASFPVYLLVGYTLFTRGYPAVREKAGMVAAYYVDENS